MTYGPSNKHEQTMGTHMNINTQMGMNTVMNTHTKLSLETRMSLNINMDTDTDFGISTKARGTQIKTFKATSTELYIYTKR